MRDERYFRWNGNFIAIDIYGKQYNLHVRIDLKIFGVELF